MSIRLAVRSLARVFLLLEDNPPIPPPREQTMSAERFLPALGLWCLACAVGVGSLAGAATSASSTAEPPLPFTIQDMVRMERISDVAVAPSGKRVAFTQRTTDMEANKGRTSVWLLDTGKRGATPLRLTDGAANASATQWSMDGRFIYFLSNRGGPAQVWRVGLSGGPHSESQVAETTQVTDLPLDVGSFRISPKDDRVLVSLDVFLDCADLSCTKQR